MIGLPLSGLVAATLVIAPRVMTADRTARLQLSIVVGTVMLFVLILGRFATGLLIPIGLAAAARICFWIPNDARRFFGDRPLGNVDAAAPPPPPPPPPAPGRGRAPAP